MEIVCFEAAFFATARLGAAFGATARLGAAFFAAAFFGATRLLAGFAPVATFRGAAFFGAVAFFFFADFRAAGAAARFFGVPFEDGFVLRFGELIVGAYTLSSDDRLRCRFITGR